MGAMSEIDVFVIGGGPVGMVLSAELARHGVRVRVADRRAEPVHHSHASILHARTQEVFDAMGIAGRWRPYAHPFARATIYAFGTVVGALELAGADSPFSVPLDVGQNVTEAILIERLGELGVTVERPVEATAVRDASGGVEIDLRRADGGTETVRAGWLVGCEGSHSIVREHCGIPFEGKRYAAREFVQTDARVRWSYTAGVGHLFIERDRFLGCFPMDGSGLFRVLCARPDRNPDDRSDPTLDEMQAIVREIADPDAVLSEPLWLNRFRTQARRAPTYRAGRMFLAGDAGHVHVPVAGQGMNTGIQDAFNLAWKLAAVVHGRAPDALLDTYSEERTPVAAGLLRGTDAGFNTLSRPNAALRFALEHLAPLALDARAVQTTLRNLVEEIAIGYRASALSEQHDRGSLRAGDRVPDALLVDVAAGVNCTAFDAMRGEGWTLFAIVDDDASLDAAAVAALQEIAGAFPDLRCRAVAVDPRRVAAGIDVLADRDRTLHDRWDVHRPTAILVRPDRYLGFRGPLDDLTALRAYLARWAAAPSATAAA